MRGISESRKRFSGRAGIGEIKLEIVEEKDSDGSEGADRSDCSGAGDRSDRSGEGCVSEREERVGLVDISCRLRRRMAGLRKQISSILGEKRSPMARENEERTKKEQRRDREREERGRRGKSKDKDKPKEGRAAARKADDGTGAGEGKSRRPRGNT